MRYQYWEEEIMVRKHCPTCLGKGTIPNPRANGKAMYLPE